jgi:fermentation-respiration switch protein FrsA (DUF1100 family)
MRWLKRLAALGIGLAILCVLGVAAASYDLSLPRPSLVGPPPADLVSLEEVLIDSGSGSRLHGWFVPGTERAGAVLLLHGIGANRLAMLGRMRMLHAAGYSVLAIDLQAHGESPGKRITFGVAEGEDAASAVAFLHRRLPDERVGVIGVSLGGAAALLAPAALPIDALVVESVFPDIGSALGDRLEIRFGPPGRLLVPVFLALAPWIVGVEPAALRPIDRIADVAAPVFVLSGTTDRNTTIDEAEALFARARPPKQMWAVSGAAHVDLQRFAGAEYDRRVLAFLGTYLRPAR